MGLYFFSPDDQGVLPVFFWVIYRLVQAFRCLVSVHLVNDLVAGCLLISWPGSIMGLQLDARSMPLASSF